MVFHRYIAIFTFGIVSLFFLPGIYAEDSTMGNCGRKPFDEIDNEDPPIPDTGVRHKGLWIRNRVWKPGQTIPVYFLNGSKESKAMVKHYASEWEKYGNFKFHFHKGKKKNTEISLNVYIQAPHERRKGICGTAYIGSGSRDNKPTIKFECLNPRTILHEFGHSLGLYHEQNNPNILGYLNREPAYKYFTTNFGYSRKWIDDNIFNPKRNSRMDWNAFDKYSVMIYSMPGEVFKDGRPAIMNAELSENDKATIQQLYPGKKNTNSSKMAYLINGDLTLNYTIRRTGRFRILVDGNTVLDARDPVEAKYFSLREHLPHNKSVNLKFIAERGDKSGVAMVRDIQTRKMETGENRFLLGFIDCHTNWCNSSRSSDLRAEAEFLVKLLNPEDYYTFYNDSEFTNDTLSSPPEELSSPSEMPPDRDWTGSYNCGIFGFLTLEKPKGNQLSGRYTYQDGVVSGVLSGYNQEIYTGNWLQKKDNARGRFVFKKEDNKLTGRWTSGNSTRWYSGWNCSK